MGLGSTTKKIQTLADTAEKMYQRLNELREKVEQTQVTVQSTGERVEKLETEIAEQRALLNAVADELGVDRDAIATDVHIAEAENESADSETEATETAEAAETTGTTEAEAASEADGGLDDGPSDE